MDHQQFKPLRVKREGTKYALKNKSTGNWFEHHQPEADLFDTQQIYFHDYQNGHKNKEEGEEEEEDDEEKYFSNKKFNSEEINRTREKVKGPDGEINWYKHENNRYYRPARKERLRTENAVKYKKKNAEESGVEASKATKFFRSGANVKDVLKNKDKIEGTHETPRWFKHPEKEEREEGEGRNGKERRGDEREYFGDELIQAPMVRLATEEAVEYKDRNVAGTRVEYIMKREKEEEEEEEEDEEEDEEAGKRWRPEGRVGSHPRAESECWFHHNEAVSGRTEHVPRRCPSRTAQETYHRSRGLSMLKIFQHQADESSTNDVHEESTPAAALLDTKGNSYHLARPFQQHFLNKTHKNNSEGLMKVVLNQQKNMTFKEPINYARAVKPEARVSSAKHKGAQMADCMTGYPDRPWEKQLHKTANVKPDFLAKQRGSYMAQAIKGVLPSTSRNVPLRAVKPEAVSNAQKGRGSLSNVFQHNDSRLDVKQPRLKSAEAKAIARRYYHGSVNNLIF